MEKSMAGKFALFGLIIAGLSFVNLLGLERALLGVIMCSMALSDPKENKTLAWIGIIVGFCAAAVLVYLSLKYMPQLTGLIKGIK